MVVDEPLDGLPSVEVRDPHRNRAEICFPGGFEPPMARYYFAGAVMAALLVVPTPRTVGYINRCPRSQVSLMNC